MKRKYMHPVCTNHLSRRSFLTAAALALSKTIRPQNAAAEQPNPNIVVILADDLGYGDLGCYGRPGAPTPHIDRLAGQGVRLTNAYVPAPTGAPARASLITGCYPQRQPNLEETLDPRDPDAGLPAGQITLPSMLRDAGYATALVGKWGLGQAREFSPNRHGWDEFFGFLGQNIDPVRHTSRLGVHDLYENEIPLQLEGHINELIAARSAGLIERRAAQSFFLLASFAAPYSENPTELTRKTVVRSIEQVDRGVGRILESLQKKDLLQNTLIVFMSDNGGGLCSRNDPLRGYKESLWEGGLRTPCIFSWPGVLPAGRISHQAVITMDVVATLLAAVKIKPTRRIDGINVLSYLAGLRPDVEQTFVWRSLPRDQRAVRWGVWKWLKIHDEEYLFHLDRDPAESVNRIDRNIDILHWLREIYSQWEDAAPASSQKTGAH
ncbi:MAG: sulfatase family protein [Candidatus Hinthialibacter sp.]